MKITKERLAQIIKEALADTIPHQQANPVDRIKMVGKDLIKTAAEMERMPSTVTANQFAGYTKEMGEELLLIHKEASKLQEQTTTSERIVHAGVIQDVTNNMNKLAGALRKLDPTTVQNQQAAELRAAFIALESSMGDVFGDSLENAVVPNSKPLEECGMADDPMALSDESMPFPGPPPEGAGAIEPAYDDHEGRMAKSQLFKMSKYSNELLNILGDHDQLPSWVQAKITKASDYLGAVKHYLEYDRASAPVHENKISRERLLKIIEEELK